MNDTKECPLIRVNDIGEYIRYHSCDRRFKLAFNKRELAKELPFAERLFNAMDPVLQESGRQREQAWEKYLNDKGLSLIEPNPASEAQHGVLLWNDFLGQLEHLTPGQHAFGREVSISAAIEGFRIEGRMDFVLLIWEGDTPHLRIVECKASRKERTYHRIQVAVYRMLVQQLIEATPLIIAGTPILACDVEAVVARIDESTSKNQAILELHPLNLETEEADARRLLASNGALARIVSESLDNLSYQIEYKCDDCVFSVHCLPESARLRGLHLLGIEPATMRALQAGNVPTIDALAELDPTGEAAFTIRANPKFTENLERLQTKAKARRKTLPGGDEAPDEYEVGFLKNVGASQLPTHEINGQRLIRIYLSVEYDYVENRIVALAAHITNSVGQLDTTFIQREGRWQPDPLVRERFQIGSDEDNRPIYNDQQLHGLEVIRFKQSPWTGNYAEDTSAERELIQGFFMELVDQIAETAQMQEAPMHFYVWTRGEMSNLVEGCSRAGSNLLGHLRELLGCRESLDQLIYSSLGEEVDRRYALGWTGRGLAVVASLKWMGRRYHWRRQIAGQEVNLDHVFTQDIFDFKTTLNIDTQGNWTKYQGEGKRHRFEIRSRFTDSLSAPYWRAYWRTLPDPSTVQEGSLRNAIHRYNDSRKPKYFQEYMKARVHALRWIEENISSKNSEIEKPLIEIANLPDFRLNVDDTAQAAIDFLRLDQHISTTNWISTHLVPPLYRVGSGKTIPVTNVSTIQFNGKSYLQAQISLANFDIEDEAFRANFSLSEGSFVRLTPCADSPASGQTVRQLLVGGFTCVIDELNWHTGRLRLSVIPVVRPNLYRLYGKSIPSGQALIFSHATIDESPSDFVAPRVDQRLQKRQGTYAYQWFHPQNSQIPPQNQIEQQILSQYQALLEQLVLPNGRSLDPTQIQAAIDGLTARIQLLQGPPGTGKTATTAAATLLRILARRNIRQVGSKQLGDIILIAANTHTAVDNLLQRIDGLVTNFISAASLLGLALPPIKLSKAHSSQPDNSVGGSVVDFSASACARNVKQLRSGAVLIIGGTTSSLLKMASKLSDSAAYREASQGFQASTLIVDEASMIVFPHFLSLATLIEEDGEIMLAGDHRQLAPIMAHDWEREDRPPVLLYQPYASAYEAVHNTRENGTLIDSQIKRSALSFTFRLPPPIRELLSRIYERDNITLDGPSINETITNSVEGDSPWDIIFREPVGLYLVLHSEIQSKRSNELEAQIIEAILSTEYDVPESSVAIVTPYSAQRSLLKQTLANHYEQTVDVIDTVERLQGDERPTVIVSATASDPSAISNNVEFILDLNRSNVAFSRAQHRLIVVCASALLDYIPADYEHYESAMLWKALRELCSERVSETQVNGHDVILMSAPKQSPLSEEMA